jgi:hypothetical protein
MGIYKAFRGTNRKDYCMFALRASFILMLTACGGAEQFQEESASQTASVGATGTAFHNPNGWNNGVVLHLDSGVPEDLRGAILEAAATWNAAIGQDVIVFEGESDLPRSDSLYGSLADGVTVTYYEPNWAETTEKSDSVIATTIWENEGDSDGYIVRGDVILNAENYHFVDATAEEQEYDETRYFVDTQTVVLHEFGHLLGLGHLDNDSSVMNPYTTIGLGSTRRVLGEVDVTNIQSIYE